VHNASIIVIVIVWWLCQQWWNWTCARISKQTNFCTLSDSECYLAGM